jgi:hypothetical protein
MATLTATAAMTAVRMVLVLGIEPPVRTSTAAVAGGGVPGLSAQRGRGPSYALSPLRQVNHRQVLDGLERQVQNPRHGD